MELVQRIKPHACLRVRQMNRRLQGEPEVREAVGKLALARHVRVGERTTADDECLRMDVVCAQEYGNIFGVMLSVGINGQSEIIPQFHGFAKTRDECGAFAFVFRMTDDVNGKIECVE